MIDSIRQLDFTSESLILSLLFLDDDGRPASKAVWGRLDARATSTHPR